MSVFLDITKILIFQEKITDAAKLKGCVTWSIYFCIFLRHDITVPTLIIVGYMWQVLGKENIFALHSWLISSYSIIFYKLLKIVSFFASWTICNEDALLMMYYHTGIHLPEKKVWTIHNHSLKHNTLEEEFNNSFSEVVTRGDRGGL